MNLPKKITPCPIVDSVVEIRFSSKVPASAVFGMVYNVLKKDYPTFENLPILQIPEPIRLSDPNFKYKPLYKLSNRETIIQLGNDVISISQSPIYQGWEKYSTEIFKVFKTINDLGIIEDVIRLGIRYSNFFRLDIFDYINLNINLNNEEFKLKNTLFRSEFIDGSWVNTLQVTNMANFNNINGSIVDIDTHTESELGKFFSNMEKLIGEGHESEKNLFFNLLKKDFLKSLNPEY